jgi:hypothetical protein
LRPAADAIFAISRQLSAASRYFARPARQLPPMPLYAITLTAFTMITRCRFSPLASFISLRRPSAIYGRHFHFDAVIEADAAEAFAFIFAARAFSHFRAEFSYAALRVD